MSKIKTFLVTGGAGFIGSHITDLLINLGHRVRVLDNFSSGRESNLESQIKNPKLEIHQIDVRAIKKNDSYFKDVDVVLHLAGIGDIVPSIENPSIYFDVNVQGTVKVLEACHFQNIKRFVYAASSSCYGLARTPTDEYATIDTRYPYALSKYLGELTAFHWMQVYKIPVNSICIFNAYGPRARTKSSYGAMFGVFLKQRLENKPLTIVGNGLQKRDFIHVKDVASAFYLASESEFTGHRFNIGSGSPVQVLEIAKYLSNNFEFLPSRPGEPQITHANIEKARSLLKWNPTIDIETGISEMLLGIESWRDAPLWDIDSITSSTQLWFKYLGDSS